MEHSHRQLDVLERGEVGEQISESEAARLVAEERVRALEEALGRFLTASPSPMELEVGLYGDKDGRDFLAEYGQAREAAASTLGPYQLDLGLASTRENNRPAPVGWDRAETAIEELELER